MKVKNKRFDANASLLWGFPLDLIGKAFVQVGYHSVLHFSYIAVCKLFEEQLF